MKGAGRFATMREELQLQNESLQIWKTDTDWANKINAKKNLAIDNNQAEIWHAISNPFSVQTKKWHECYLRDYSRRQNNQILINALHLGTNVRETKARNGRNIPLVWFLCSIVILKMLVDTSFSTIFMFISMKFCCN